MDILCTDKTGTLTEGTIVLDDASDAGEPAVGRGPPARLSQRGIRDRHRKPARCRDRRGGRERRADDRTASPRSTKSPTTSCAGGSPSWWRRTATPTQHLIVTKGAFSNVLDICSSLERDGVDVPLDDAERAPSSRRSSRPRAPRASASWPWRRAGSRRKAHYDRDDETGHDVSRLSASSSTRPRRTRSARSTTSPGSASASR